MKGLGGELRAGRGPGEGEGTRGEIVAAGISASVGSGIKEDMGTPGHRERLCRNDTIAPSLTPQTVRPSGGEAHHPRSNPVLDSRVPFGLSSSSCQMTGSPSALFPNPTSAWHFRAPLAHVTPRGRPPFSFSFRRSSPSILLFLGSTNTLTAATAGTPDPRFLFDPVK